MKLLKTGGIFLLGFAMYLLCVLPFVIYRGGVFAYYGDYNVQQVPFYIMCHRMVKDGYLYWNPLLDLGSDIGAAFAMYLWGSPFFWLTIPFPERVIPQLMPVLMGLKYGAALTGAFLWLKPHTKTEHGALIGALLYAFSGFQGTNIVFAHFHDVTAFFPFYLLSFDRAAEKKKYALPVFSVMTAFMLALNYYFFFGQIIFLILYWLLRRMPRRGLLPAFAETGRFLLAGLLGGGLSAAFWVRLITGFFGNSRLGNTISGYDLFCYPGQTTFAAIVKSFFMLPDPSGRGTLFTNNIVTFSSIAGYLPSFAMTGVIAFFLTHRRDRRKNLLILFALMAAIPVLNASFSAFNSTFYARWYYMPILLMAEATALSLEENRTGALRRGAEISICAFAVFMLCSFAPTGAVGRFVAFGLVQYPEILLTQSAVTAILFVPLIYMVYALSPRRGIGTGGLAGRGTAAAVALCCMVSTCGALLCGTTIVSNSGKDNWLRQMLASDPVPAAREEFLRVETDDSSTNYDMVWGYPQLHCFQSTVSPSVLRFYRGIGLVRSVESSLPLEKIGARAILSGRYYLETLTAKAPVNYTENGGMRGYILTESTPDYSIYENKNCIPMGFTFTQYMTEENYRKYSANSETADRLLVKNLILSEEDAARYGYLLAEDRDIEQKVMMYPEFEEHCEARRRSACTSFTYDRDGYTAEAELPRENLVFFSIPYDRGFTALVDGERAEIIRADFGLTAVPVPAGRHVIRLYYRPYGSAAGTIVSALSAAVLLLMLAAEKRRRLLNKQNGKCYDKSSDIHMDQFAEAKEVRDI